MTNIKQVDLEAFIQATEDPEKVRMALKRLIPSELDITFTEEKVRGVYHNPITVIRAKFVKKGREFVENLAQNLSEMDKKYIFQSLNRRLEKKKLYLRIGKQELFQGKISIKEIKDTVKIKIKFSRKFANQEELIKLLKQVELIIT